MKIEKDFHQFSPDDYLNEYYSNIGSENEFLLRFFHKTYNRLNPSGRLLEVGGGPVIYQLISACYFMDEIIFSEYNLKNRIAVASWVANDSGIFDWDPYIIEVLSLEGKDESSLLERKSLLRDKIKAYVPYDARKNPPIDSHAMPFDVISTNFCFESITNNETEYRSFFHNLSSLIKSGTYLIATALKNASYYQVGPIKFPAFPIDENYLNDYLLQLNYNDVQIDTVAAEHSQGYDGIMTICATKK